MANLTANNDIQIIDNKATILGTAEADEILATQTNDHQMIRILAGAGDDIVLVNSGNNEVYGEEGDDFFSILTIGNHTVDGGNGQDTVRLWSVDPYRLSSYANDNGVIRLSSNFATHTFTNVEVFSFYFTSPYPYIDRVLSVAELNAFYNSQDQVLIGTVNDDVLIGAFGNDTINGTDGADTLDGRQGNDTLNGGAGNDIIIGNEGNNTIDGGEGDDTYDYNSFSYPLSFPYSYYSPRLFIDSIKSYSHQNGIISISSIYGTDNITNVEYFKIGGITYTVSELDSIFSTADQTISGTSETDFLMGGLGRDTINSLEGDDEISARDGDDTVNSGVGNDEVYGGNGHDLINLDLGDDRAYGEEGNDTINGNDGNDHLSGGDGLDELNGGVGDDRLFGGTGSDILDGGEGADWLYSNDGSYAGDGLSGDNSEDQLYGGAGNDYFYGDLGNDYMNGGDDLDIFVLPYLNRNEIYNISKLKNGGYLISSAYGNDEIQEIEYVSFQDGTTTPIDLMAEKSQPNITFNDQIVKPQAYIGPVDYLEYVFFGESTNDVIIGSLSNDFFNLYDGDDAADGGIGDDVLDGGKGSNFLTGGQGSDTFFLDGRETGVTWSTITDFAGDEVNIWGWVDGTSQLLLAEENNGAEGFKGATLHYDLNNDSTIDTTVTFTGLNLSEVPKSLAKIVEDNGYLLFA